jgi:hypothetical protein
MTAAGIDFIGGSHNDWVEGCILRHAPETPAGGNRSHRNALESRGCGVSVAPVLP